MKQKLIVFVAVFGVLLVGLFMWRYPWAQEGSGTGIDWSNEESVFNVSAPADLDPINAETFGEKVTAARELYRKEPDDSWTYVVVADVYDYVQDYDKTILALQHALELNPTEETAILNLAVIYEKYAPDYALAEQYYRTFLELNDSRADAYTRFARFLYQKKKDFSAAESILLAGREKTGDSSDILVEMIAMYKKQENEEKRLAVIKELLELFPDNEVFKYQYGDVVR